MDNAKIKHDEEKQKFYMEIDNKECYLSYEKIDKSTLDYQSTFVPKELRGNKLGEKIVLHALDYAKSNDMKIIPSCPFVKQIIDLHPKYESVVKTLN